MKPPKNRAILKAETPATPPQQPSSVIVRVVRQAVGENGTTYLAGQTFETTPARAAALGSLVEKI